MFRIKICGVTNVPDAITAVEAGACAIGLNFYKRSPRFVEGRIARQISDAATGGVIAVGVFVNHTFDETDRIVTEANLEGLQFHGNEPPELIARWAGLYRDATVALGGERWESGPDLAPCVIRAHRLRHSDGRALVDELSRYKDAGCLPGAVLIDAHVEGTYGGTGSTLHWNELADYKNWLGDTPLILAGGLTPDNVAEAIRIVRPHGVDVASGVESAPGKKDPHKVRDFIAAARAAFDAL